MKNNYTLSILQIKNNLPPQFREILDSGKMRIRIIGISEGSVVVYFIIEMVVNSNITHSEIEAAIIDALNKSKDLDIDLHGTSIKGTAFACIIFGLYRVHPVSWRDSAEEHVFCMEMVFCMETLEDEGWARWNQSCSTGKATRKPTTMRKDDLFQN